MKRYLLFFVTLCFASILLMSCSEEDGITSTDRAEEEVEEADGGVSFTFSSSANAKMPGLVSYSSTVDSLPEPTNVRVVIRRYEEDQYGREEIKYNTLGDVEVPTDTTMVLTVPVADNYEIVAFSYVDSTSNLSYLLKYDSQSSISVEADNITQVSLSLDPIYPEVSLPDSVDKGDQFTIGVNFDKFGVAPERQFLAYINSDTTFAEDLVYNLDNRTNANYHGSDYLADWELSESEIEDRYAYFRTQFLLTSDEYYKSSESGFSFRYYYPNPFMTNDTLKTYIKAPAGGVGVNVEY